MSSARMCAAICGIIVVIITIALVGSSFGYLHPTEIGIVQNTVQKGIDDTKIYTNGRYYLGLGKSFLIYPTTKQNIYFGSSSNSGFGSPDAAAIVVRVPQGQVTIEASLQYSININNVINLYRNFQMDYHRRLVTIASSTVQTTLQQLSVNDFYTNRTLVQTLAETSLKTALAAQYVIFHDFQLRKVTLPSANEAQIVQKIISEVRQVTASIVQTQQQVDAQTTVLVGQIDQEITVFVANKTNEANIILNNAKADATAIRLKSESSAFTAFQDYLDFNNTELLRYLYYRQLWTASNNAKITTGFDNIIGRF